MIVIYENMRKGRVWKMKKYSEADLTRMSNGKNLPEGLTKTKHGSYRTQRQINRKKYTFPTIRNSELALEVNRKVEEMANDFKKEEVGESSNLDEIATLIAENGKSDMEEITRLIGEKSAHLNERITFLIEQNARLHDRLDTELNKTLWQRITGR